MFFPLNFPDRKREGQKEGEREKHHKRDTSMSCLLHGPPQGPGIEPAKAGDEPFKAAGTGESCPQASGSGRIRCLASSNRSKSGA